MGQPAQLSEIQCSLYPDWQPREIPSWILKLKGKGRDLFIRRASLRPGLLSQLSADKLDNLAPFCLYLDADPRGCRKAIGKGLWKFAHKGSLSTNKYRVLLNLRKGLSWNEVFSIPPVNLKTVLYWKGQMRPRELYAARHGNPRNVTFREVLIYLRDAKSLGVDVSLDWSLRRLIKEHDRASEALERQRSAEEMAVITAPFCTPWAFSADGYTATVLCSPSELAEEGRKMRHCVGSYAPFCRSGDVVVFRIDGAARATLSFAFLRTSGDLHPIVAIDQVKGRFNGRVDAATKAFAEKVRRAFVKAWPVPETAP